MCCENQKTPHDHEGGCCGQTHEHPHTHEHTHPHTHEHTHPHTHEHDHKHIHEKECCGKDNCCNSEEKK